MCRPSGPDELGALDDAWIDLRGHRMRMTMTYSFPEETDAYLHDNFALSGYDAVLDNDEDTELAIDYALWEDGPRHLESGTQVFLLPIIQGGQWIVCLILARFEQQREVHERIGILTKKDFLQQFPMQKGVREGQRRHECWKQCNTRLV